MISSLNTRADANWWKHGVIYQIYPRSFADSNADGVGDLRGICRHLDYVASLGVDAIWLSPIFKSPMKDFGYDIEDYRAIDPLFGDLEDFDALIKRAHELHLKVVIDQVLSHTSDLHPWFTESRASRDNARADWYVWADANADGSPPNNWRSVFGGSAWTWDTRRKQYYLHNFLVAQPDLNFHTPAVQQQVLDDMRFWLERGVDGFRLDTTNYFHHDAQLRDNPPNGVAYTALTMPANPYEMQHHIHDKNRPENVKFLEKVRVLLDEYGAASVGEVGDADALQTMVDYTRDGRRLHMTYSFAFLNRERSASQIRRHVEEFHAAAHSNGAWPCWTYGNHDSARVATRWSATDAIDPFVRVAMASLFSLRGSSCWYQGDELGLTEADLPFEALQDPPGIAMWPEYKGRDGCRTPMPWRHLEHHAGFSAAAGAQPWLPIPAEHVARSVDLEEQRSDAPLHFMRALLKWRKSVPALTAGAIRFMDMPGNVLAFVRTDDPTGVGPGILCLFNFDGTPVDAATPSLPNVKTIELPGIPDAQRILIQGLRASIPAWGIGFFQIEI